MKIRPMGDSALVCEVEDLATVHRLRAAIRAAAFDDVVDVVPGWRTVLVTATEPAAVSQLARALPTLALPPSEHAGGREHVIPVEYDGPDLDDVARHTGLTVDDVVRRHARATYTVAFLGFQPGFPYLAGLDRALTTPRKATPRTDVPAGAVGIAGDVTGIYPQSSPGGWQIIGSTRASLFDSTREQPALLAPGDTVRFEA
jgi:KipI family sensor histidine kinase inhibitor